MSSTSLNSTLVIRLQPDALSALARIRADGQPWQVCESDGHIWLRSNLDSANNAELLSLPGQRYSLLPDDNEQLVPVGSRVPQAYLPEGDWQPLREWLQLRLGQPAVAGAAPQPVRLELVRTFESREANVLLTTADNWAEFAGSTAQVRLAKLTFAAATIDEPETGAESSSDVGMLTKRPVVVRGVPCPPVPGTAFVETEGIAVPAGWQWSPALDVSVLRAAFGSTSKDLIFLSRDGTHDRIPADAFVQASRHAARQLLKGVA